MTTFYAHRKEQVRDHFIYRHFDANGLLLYVGCSVRPFTRLKEHKSNRAEWVEKVAASKMAGPYTYRRARQLEREALLREEPLYGSTPVRLSAEARRQNWIKKRLHELLDVLGVEVIPGGPLDEYYAAHDLAAEEAARIDWDAIARRHVLGSVAR